MNGFEIALLVAVCVGFAVAVGIIVYNKATGKSSCGDCASCEACGACHKSDKKISNNVKAEAQTQASGFVCDGRCAHCKAACKGENGTDPGQA